MVSVSCFGDTTQGAFSYHQRCLGLVAALWQDRMKKERPEPHCYACPQLSESPWPVARRVSRQSREAQPQVPPECIHTKSLSKKGPAEPSYPAPTLVSKTKDCSEFKLKPMA